jgi:hypothetical protein
MIFDVSQHCSKTTVTPLFQQFFASIMNEQSQLADFVQVFTVDFDVVDGGGLVEDVIG